MMTGELEHHISESKLAGQPNRKNGKSKKTVRSLSSGEFELETGRGRLSTFDPKVVPKRQLIIAEELEGNILSMYGARNIR
jgi:transposase-like protein